jgi:hypothetical protein
MNHNKKVDEFLDPLETISSASPSPYLFTRIQSKILASKSGTVSRKAVIASVAFLVLLLLINIAAITRISSGTHERNVATVFQLMPFNNLYAEHDQDL